MNYSRRLSTGILLVGGVLQGLSVRVVAADERNTAAKDTGGLEEIIVTAARREENQAKVPISITAFTQATLDQNTVRTVDDIAKMTPGVQFSRTNDEGAIGTITIRGIQSNAGASTNGVYIDDTPVQMRQDLGGLGTSVWPQIFDLERVEVLRGPQGTLFGSGSMGGAIRLITPQPSTTKSTVYARGDLGFTAGGAPSQEAGLAFNVPLIDNVLGLQMSGSYRNDGGYVSRMNYWTGKVTEKNSNYTETRTFRLAMAWKPLENLTITPSFYWQKQYFNDSGNYWLELSKPSDNYYNRAGEIPDQTWDRFGLPALKAQWDLGSISVFSNTSYFDRSQFGIQDLATFEPAIWAGKYYPPPGVYAPSYNTSNQTVFTQELRVQSATADSRLTWVGGLFFQRSRQRFIEKVQDTFLPALVEEANPGKTFEEVIGSPLVDGLYTVLVNPWDTVDKQIAAFGQVDFKLTSKLKATVGLRVERADLSSYIVYSGPVNGPVPVTFAAKVSETPVTPKYGLSYQLTEGTMLYTTIAKGYRIGGTNQPVAINCGSDLQSIGLAEEPQGYKSDSLWSYELGGKMRSPDGRFALDASVYLIKWKDLQVNYNLPSCGYSFTTNAGQITSKGFELAAQARPIRNLSLGASLGYTKAATDNTYYYGGSTTPSFPGEADIIAGGDRQLVAPWTASVFSEYSFNVLSHDSYFRLNYNYADGLNRGIPSQDPNNGNYDTASKGLQVQQDLTLKLGAHFGDLDTALYVNNAINQHPLTGYGHPLTSSPLFTAYATRPRTIGVTAIYRY